MKRENSEAKYKRIVFVLYAMYIYARSFTHIHSLWPHGSSLPGFSVRGILQARILEWVAISYSKGSSQPRDQTYVCCTSCTGRWVLYHQHHMGSQFSTLWCEEIYAVQDRKLPAWETFRSLPYFRAHRQSPLSQEKALLACSWEELWLWLVFP